MVLDKSICRPEKGNVHLYVYKKQTQVKVPEKGNTIASKSLKCSHHALC